MLKLKVGQKVWFRSRWGSAECRDVTILSVGRRWATAEGINRIEISTGEVAFSEGIPGVRFGRAGNTTSLGVRRKMRGTFYVTTCTKAPSRVSRLMTLGKLANCWGYHDVSAS